MLNYKFIRVELLPFLGELKDLATILVYPSSSALNGANIENVRKSGWNLILYESLPFRGLLYCVCTTVAWPRCTTPSDKHLSHLSALRRSRLEDGAHCLLVRTRFFCHTSGLVTLMRIHWIPRVTCICMVLLPCVL